METNLEREAHIFMTDDDDIEAISIMLNELQQNIMSLFKRRQLACYFKDGQNDKMVTNLKMYDNSRTYTKDLVQSTMF